MTKQELVSYLGNLLQIGGYLNNLGVSHSWLNREANDMVAELEDIIKNEQEVEDEARKSDEQRTR